MVTAAAATATTAGAQYPLPRHQAFSLTMSMPGNLPPSNMPDSVRFKSTANHHIAAPSSLSSSSPSFSPQSKLGNCPDRLPTTPRSHTRPQSYPNAAPSTHQLSSSLPDPFTTHAIPCAMGGGYDQSPTVPMSQEVCLHTPSYSHQEPSFLEGSPGFPQNACDQKVFSQGGSPNHPVFAHTITDDSDYTLAVDQASPCVSSYVQTDNLHQYFQNHRDHKRRSSPAALENSYRVKSEQYDPTTVADVHTVMSVTDQNMSAEEMAGSDEQMDAAILLANLNPSPLPEFMSRKGAYRGHRMSLDGAATAHPLQAPPMCQGASMLSYSSSIVLPFCSHPALHTHGKTVYAGPNDTRRHSLDSWSRLSPHMQPDGKPVYDEFSTTVPTSTVYGSRLPPTNNTSSLPSVMEPSSSSHYRTPPIDYVLSNSARRLTWTQNSGSIPAPHDGVSGSGIMDSSIHSTATQQQQQGVYDQQYPQEAYTATRYPPVMKHSGVPHSSNPSYTSTQQKRKSALLDEAIPDISSGFEDLLSMGPSPSLQGTQPPPSPTDSLFRKRTKSLDMSDMSFCDESDMGDMSMEDGAADIGADGAPYPEMTQEDTDATNPDPDAVPRSQRLRYNGDKYTPQWVRHQGQQKEGFCDLCRPGKWLQLKNSAYWYHKQFFHGISSVSGKEFERPQEQRWADSELVEGLCHQCHHWVPVQNSKRKNSVLWYRHAHKCHVYHKQRAQQTHLPKKR